MPNNYDPIARYYDQLSRLVFNKAQVNAQLDQLHWVPAPSRILIVGGGSGWILKALAARHACGLTITYVESSAQMLAMASKVDVKENQVDFVHAAIEYFQPNQDYDVIMTAFLFDNFKAEQAARVFMKLYHLLKSGGHWLYTDFCVPKAHPAWWQRFLLRSMYIFFKLVAGVEANQLPDMELHFKQQPLRLIFQRHYYRHLIESNVFEKLPG